MRYFVLLISKSMARLGVVENMLSCWPNKRADIRGPLSVFNQISKYCLGDNKKLSYIILWKRKALYIPTAKRFSNKQKENKYMSKIKLN